MKLYEGTVNDFVQDVLQNRIAELLSEKFLSYYSKKVSPSEFNSWNNSLRVLSAVGYNLKASFSLKTNCLAILFLFRYLLKKINIPVFMQKCFRSIFSSKKIAGVCYSIAFL